MASLRGVGIRREKASRNEGSVASCFPFGVFGWESQVVRICQYKKLRESRVE